MYQNFIGQNPRSRLPCSQCLLHLFTKSLQRHQSGHKYSSFMQCWETLIRSCLPKSCSTALQWRRRGRGSGRKERKEERKKEGKGGKDTLTFSEPLAAHFLLLDQRRGRGSWSRQRQGRSASWKKRECKVHNCPTTNEC